MSRIMTRILVAVSLSLVLLVSVVSGATIRVPADRLTIRAGIKASVDGDTVLVADGTYTGTGNKNLDFEGKALTVLSENGPDFTVIDCENSGRGFNFHSEEDSLSSLIGFTVRNGKVPGYGGGIRCYQSSPNILNCTICENTADTHGGGIYCNDSASPKISDCRITDNFALISGGIHCRSHSAPIITNSKISGNTADNEGGGIHCLMSSPTITGCEITWNAAETGGGIKSLSSLNIFDCDISWNDSDGIYGSSGLISNCTISGNGGDGLNKVSATISDCTISGNFGDGLNYCSGLVYKCTISENSGCGIAEASDESIITNCTISRNRGFSGIYCYYDDPTIRGCTISDNFGSGIACYYSDPVIKNCIISGNREWDGGGIYCDDSSPTISGCLISGNSANAYGGGIYCIWSHSSPVIINCTISGNVAGLDGGGICSEYEAYPWMVNCILWGDSPNEIDEIYGGPNIKFSSIQGGWSGQGNIDENPRFVAPYEGDFRLKEYSPCIDTGDPTYSVPLGGGSRIDMGAYEYWHGWNILPGTLAD